MVNWQDPAVIARCAAIEDKLSLFMLGVFCWYLLTTLSYVEIPLIRGRIEWRWGYLCYLCGRYSALICRLTALFMTGPTGIQATAITGSIAVICATGNLLTRTMVLWKDTQWVIWLLAVAEVGHWGFTIAGLWVPLISVSLGRLSILEGAFFRSHLPAYIYTCSLDFLTLVFTIWGLYHRELARPHKMWQLLYRQGVMYFLVTFLLNVPLLVLDQLNLNFPMAIMFTGPAVTIGTMASSAALATMYKLGMNDHDQHVFVQGPTTNPTQKLTTHLTVPHGVAVTETNTNMSAQTTTSRGSCEKIDIEAQR